MEPSPLECGRDHYPGMGGGGGGLRAARPCRDVTVNIEIHHYIGQKCYTRRARETVRVPPQ